jgi:hypothetical protein
MLSYIERFVKKNLFFKSLILKRKKIIFFLTYLSGYVSIRYNQERERFMAKLVITTQIKENYGAHTWDGKGECPQRWKFKGGNDYVVLNVDINNPATVINTVIDQCEENNEYYKEYILGWEVVADNWISDYEKFQLEYDGKITIPQKILNS